MCVRYGHAKTEYNYHEKNDTLFPSPTENDGIYGSEKKKKTVFNLQSFPIFGAGSQRSFVVVVDRKTPRVQL